MKELQKKRTRRNFVFELLLGWTGMLFLPVLYVIVKYLIPPKLIDTFVRIVSAGKLSQIPPNTAKIVKFNKKPVIVLHQADGSVKAFSATCTHLGCTVDFDPAAQNVSGPARSPLTAFKVIQKDDDLSVTPQGL